jgi:DNA-binding LacI/PurR family transcriptional regulator
MPRNKGLPHYRRIADRLLAGLAKGGNFRVPSENALARAHGVARMTARRALEHLRAHGYIERIQGSGSFSRHVGARTVHYIGYSLAQSRFTRFRSRLLHNLGNEGIHLLTVDAGVSGTDLDPTPELIGEIRNSEAVIWLAPSHPSGAAAAVRLRRKLPVKLPMVLINDPLGLSLHGTHRFDLLHFDAAEAARRMVDLLARRGIAHPLLVLRRDVKLYSVAEIHRGFVAAMHTRNVPEALLHALAWNPPERLERVIREAVTKKRKGWKPDGFVLEYDYFDEFQAAMRSANTGLPVFAFGRGATGLNPAGDTKVLADVCTELLFSRLKTPNRPNLHVQAAIPPRAGKG